jgi:hypothetical protein
MANSKCSMPSVAASAIVAMSEIVWGVAFQTLLQAARYLR